jgi:hypothetical protein
MESIQTIKCLDRSLSFLASKAEGGDSNTRIKVLIDECKALLKKRQDENNVFKEISEVKKNYDIYLHGPKTDACILRLSWCLEEILKIINTNSE